MSTQWLLVADASRARILATDAALGSLLLVKELEHPLSRLRSSELVTDGPGRSWSGPGGAVTAYDAPHDPAQLEHERFARELAGELETGLAREDFDTLILVAPPRFLGMLRRQLAPPVARCVRAEVGRDYSLVSLSELPGMLRPQLAA